MISIIIPVYNCQKYLEQCLDSILFQTYKDIEVLCIDDKSSDESLTIIKKYVIADPRVRLIQLEANLGSGPARNRGISEASGEYITFCDADDIYPDYALERMYTALLNSNADICVGNIKLMSKDMSYPIPYQEPLASLHIDEYKLVSPLSCPQLWFPWYHQRFMFRKKFLLENSISYPNFLRGQDPPMLAKALCLAKSAIIIPDTVYKYRISSFKKFSHRQYIDYISHINKTINIYDSFGHPMQANLYAKMILYFADSFAIFKQFQKDDRKNIINFYIHLIKNRNTAENFLPYHFPEGIESRINSMKYGIVFYGIHKLVTKYLKKIKNYVF